MEVIRELISLGNEALPILGFVSATLASLYMYVFHGRKKKDDGESEKVPPVLQGTPIQVGGDTFEIRTLKMLQARIDELEEERDKAHDLLRANNIQIPK